MVKSPDTTPPYLGAIVTYVDPHMGDKYPGIVTRVLNDEGLVNLTVFMPGNTPHPAPQASPRDPEGKVRGSWHWRIE